jgi:DNA repair protein RecO (recombination protein O)
MSLLPHPVVSSEAWILRTWPTGEASVIASLLTERYGYVRVIAKGARGASSVLRPLVESGRLASLEFSLAAGRQLQYLRGGSVRLDPLAQKASLERSAFLLAAVEFVDCCRPQELQSSRLFAVCCDYVRMLSCSAPGSEAYLFYALELALLNLHGLAPALDDCAVCGRPLPSAGPGERAFSIETGGVVCRGCAASDSRLPCRELAEDVLGAMRMAQERALAELPFNPPERRVMRQMGIALHHFMVYHLPSYRLPAALDLLKPHWPGRRRGAVSESRDDQEP